MGRLNRVWLGAFLIGLGHRVLPKHIRDEWDLQFKRKLHDIDTSRFDT
jgi:hypothetical protein